MVARITGFGDYSINSNSISMGQSVPTFHQGGDGVRICHREFLTDVTGSVAFTLNSYAIQPGLSSSFPWLASVTTNFEEYQMLGLVYEYRPSSGSAVSSASSALGVVVLATNYDVLDDVFPNKQAMESYEFSTSQVPFSQCIHAVECAPRSNVLTNLYTRGSSIPAGADQRMYDIGLFQIATSGMQSPYVIGELWVSYDILLKKPRIPSSLQSTISYTHFTEGAVNTASATHPFGSTSLVVRHADDPSIIIDTGNLPYIQFEAVGSYCCFFVWYILTGTVTGLPTPSLGANLASLNGFEDRTTDQVAWLDTGDASIGVAQMLSVVTAGSTSSNRLTIGGLTGLTTGKLDIFIFRVSTTAPTARALPVEMLRLRPTKEILERKGIVPDDHRPNPAELKPPQVNALAQDLEFEHLPAQLPVTRRSAWFGGQ